jgi:phosphatidyl-myo-inositol dimannoside synthase
MKLAILTLDFPPGIGGVQTYLYEIARRLGQEHTIAVITPVLGDSPSAASLTRVKPSPKNMIGFWRALSRLGPDSILVGHAHPQLLAAAACYAPGKYATIAHGNDYLAAQQRWHHPIFNHLLVRSYPLITTTNVHAERIQRLGLSRPVVIYPGTDQERFAPAATRTPMTPVLLTVGRLVPRKGIDTVLQALPQILRVHPDVEYRIVGSGPDESRLRALARKLKIEVSVKFLGAVSDGQLPSVYRDAHIYVMPAREEQQSASIEGFGIVYLEASASGLPVVAGRSGGVVEAVRDGKTGYLVDPHAPGALADILIRLLQDHELRVRLGARGRQWVEEKMNWDRAAQEIAEALKLT